jgi:hypothetical protein
MASNNAFAAASCAIFVELFWLRHINPKHQEHSIPFTWSFDSL